MTTPSGQISLSQVNAELGFSPTAVITMNDAAVRTLAGVPTGAISMANLQGKSNRPSIALNITNPAYNYDVYTNRGPTYVPGSSDITVTISPGAVVGSTSTGSFAFLVPSSFSPGDTVTVVNNGVIQGRGGNGAGGGSASVPGSNPGGAGTGGTGSTGGAALSISRPTTITNNGTIAGGGGGGGGGGEATGPAVGGAGGGGGGGGAGFDGGTGGPGGSAAGGVGPQRSPGSTGGTGTSPAGGGGGSGGGPVPGGPQTFVLGGSGGTGGGRGASGSSGNPGSFNPNQIGFDNPATAAPGGGGGSPGAYISGLPFVTWPATGTRLGPSS